MRRANKTGAIPEEFDFRLLVGRGVFSGFCALIVFCGAAGRKSDYKEKGGFESTAFRSAESRVAKIDRAAALFVYNFRLAMGTKPPKPSPRARPKAAAKAPAKAAVPAAPKRGGKVRPKIQPQTQPKKPVAAKAASGKKSVARKEPVVRRSVFKSYHPRAAESYMCARQIEHFREVFEAIRHEINFGMDLTVTHMRESPNTIPDENDRASKESEFTIELRERDRDRNLLSKVVRALGRIQTGDFGFCESCDDPIGLDRLLARPVTTMCIECKRLQEYREKTFAK